MARQIADTVGFEGGLVFDASRPDGTPRKLMDSSRLLGLGWAPRIELAARLADAYRQFLESDRARFAQS